MQELSANDFYEQEHGHHQFLSKGTIINILEKFRNTEKQPEPEKKEVNDPETLSVHLGN